MQNLQNDLIQLLKTQNNLVIEGELNKNKIVEAALKLDPKLIGLLVKNETFKKHFFQEVEDVLVFDKIKFQRFVNNKSFLPDSYTAFKNKIGLTINDGSTDNYIKANNDVVLAWPHKDCVLEGGQTKEDQKRNEIFWNETLAPDNVDRLLDPKAFTNFKKYDKDGEHEVSEITENDNLILKGNNLLAISSLLKTHRGKIKLIYIDPPYNTGNDDFNYNDAFNHSAWLTFMRNRLEIAKNLLSDDGSIWINIDDGEVHYLKVLTDDIFNRDNFIANCIWEKKNVVQNDAKFFSTKHDHILVFSKKIENFSLNLLERTEEMDARYNNPDNDPRGSWTSVALQAKSGSKDNIYEVQFDNGVKWKPVPGTFPRLNKNSLLKAYEENRLWFGKSGKNVPRLKKFLSEVKGGRVPNTIFSNKEAGSTQSGKEHLKKIFSNNPFSTPKPEKLMQLIIKLSTNPNDIVLDFFMGSGTTLTTAHKMNRRYIGIEQMDYIETVTVERLKKVIAEEKGGISKDVNWKGGGSFIYAELMEYNQKYISQIQKATTKEELLEIWKEMDEKAFLSFQFDKSMFNERLEAFKTASLEDMKQYLLEILDKNQLYVNYSEIDDETYNVSEEDKALNRSFYNQK